jgi:hypothetical protein
MAENIYEAAREAYFRQTGRHADPLGINAAVDAVMAWHIRHMPTRRWNCMGKSPESEVPPSGCPTMIADSPPCRLRRPGKLPCI